jgi:hypothetical protein
MRLQETRNLEGVLAMLPHAQGQRLRTLEEQEGIEGTQRRSEIAQQLQPDLEHESDVSCARHVAKGIP